MTTVDVTALMFDIVRSAERVVENRRSLAASTPDGFQHDTMCAWWRSVEDDAACDCDRGDLIALRDALRLFHAAIAPKEDADQETSS